MQEYLFGIDPSLSNTGISIFDLLANPIEILSIYTNNKKSRGCRLLEIYNKLNDLKNKYDPKIIVCENSFFRFNKASEAVWEVRGIIELIFNDCEIIFYAPTSIKKAITGNGKSSKEELQSFILNKYNGIEFSNQDESDSYAIGLSWFYKNGVIK